MGQVWDGESIGEQGQAREGERRVLGSSVGAKGARRDGGQWVRAWTERGEARLEGGTRTRPPNTRERHSHRKPRTWIKGEVVAGLRNGWG